MKYTFRQTSWNGFVCTANAFKRSYWVFLCLFTHSVNNVHRKCFPVLILCLNTIILKITSSCQCLRFEIFSRFLAWEQQGENWSPHYGAPELVLIFTVKHMLSNWGKLVPNQVAQHVKWGLCLWHVLENFLLFLSCCKIKHLIFVESSCSDHFNSNLLTLIKILSC